MLKSFFRVSLNYHQSATKIKKQFVGKWGGLGVKMFFYECVVWVCLTLGTIFLVIAVSMAIGFLKGVLTISFALPIALYKSLSNLKKV